MIRLTHRRCRHETAALADTARRQTEHALALAVQNEALADDLRAAGFQADEIAAACETEEYAAEAAIPEVLRERLFQAYDGERVLTDHVNVLDQIQRLTGQLQAERERADQGVARYVQARTRMLAAAHAAGTLARTYALAEGAGMGCTDDEADQVLARVRITVWHGLPGWGCQDTDCPEGVRELVWHTDAPERGHLVCRCGRIWQAGPAAVERGERETRTHQALGGGYTTTHRWSQMHGAVLEAIDRALPEPRTETTVRREAVASA